MEEGQARAATLEHERLRRQELMAAQQCQPKEIALLDQPGIQASIPSYRGSSSIAVIVVRAFQA